jgi:hypothetical protein
MKIVLEEIWLKGMVWVHVTVTVVGSCEHCNVLLLMPWSRVFENVILDDVVKKREFIRTIRFVTMFLSCHLYRGLPNDILHILIFCKYSSSPIYATFCHLILDLITHAMSGEQHRLRRLCRAEMNCRYEYLNVIFPAQRSHPHPRPCVTFHIILTFMLRDYLISVQAKGSALAIFCI